MSLSNKIKVIGASALIGLGSLCFAGCSGEDVDSNKDVVPEKKDYFASFKMDTRSGMAITSGDFDKDGDLDLIVGALDYWLDGRLYFYENDGKGNFSKRMY